MSYLECYTWREVRLDKEAGELYIQVDLSEDLIDTLIDEVSTEVSRFGAVCDTLEGMKNLKNYTECLKNLIRAKDAFANYRIEEMSKPVEEPQDQLPEDHDNEG